MAYAQNRLRGLLLDSRRLDGLYLSLTSLRGEKHDSEGCRCEKGFDLVQATLDLSEWKNQMIGGQWISLELLLEIGFLQRVVFTNPFQIKEIIPLLVHIFRE